MSDVFAPSRTVSSIDDCYFYHTIDLPNVGTVSGEWDLRGRERDYLGHVDFKGKKVLEIGTASGYLCFWMERHGAEMHAYDLSDAQDWDIVPHAGTDFAQQVGTRKAMIRQLNNSWWFSHRQLGSRARVAYGTVYDLSDRLGRFDIVTVSCILLHLRDPFLALQRAASVATDTIIVTDMAPLNNERAVLDDANRIRFLPNARAQEPVETWWQLSPGFISEVLSILGFSDLKVHSHRQLCRGNEFELFTVVAHRRTVERDSRTVADKGSPANKYRLHSTVLAQIPSRRLLRELLERVRRRLPLTGSWGNNAAV